MGSQVMTTLTEQRGNRTTNPNGEFPEPSNPIEQIGSTQTIAPSRPIEQRAQIETAGDGGTGTSFSKPVLQRGALVFPRIGPPEGDDDAIIDQRNVTSGGHPSDPNTDYEGPVEQVEIIKSNEPVQQFQIIRANVDGTPIEQKPGIDNTVNIEQFDFIELIFPPCGSVKNPTNTNLLWRIRDFGFPFDVETLIFRVQGVEVQDRDSFSVTDLGTGLELFYNPPDDFPFDTIVEVFLEISDTAVPSNSFFVRCSWTTVPDTRPPVITNVTPCDQGSGVSVTEKVTFDVYDTGDGVDLDSIVLSIEGIPVCSGLSFDPEIFPGSGNGFHVEWDHPFDPFKYNANVTVAITAGDLAVPQNSALFVCDFDTEDSNPPEFTNFDPGPCDSFIDTATGLTFEVYGDIHGVDITTLEVRVDNKLRRVFVEPRILRSQ